jgi:hypothetical protein
MYKRPFLPLGYRLRIDVVALGKFIPEIRI